MEKDIKQWFSNKEASIEEGVELFAMYGKNTTLLKKFKRNPKAHSERLKYELSKLAKLKPSACEKKVLIEPETVAPGPQTKTDTENDDDYIEDVEKTNIFEKQHEFKVSYDQCPVEIQNYIREKSDLAKERGILHTTLVEIGDSNDSESIAKRKTIVAQIKKGQERLDTLVAYIKDYEDNGVINVEGKESSTKSDTSPSESILLINTRNNLRASLSKDKKAYSTLNKGPKKDMLAKRIAEKEAKIEVINAKIK